MEWGFEEEGRGFSFPILTPTLQDNIKSREMKAPNQAKYLMFISLNPNP